jgi:hypothetical protein
MKDLLAFLTENCCGGNPCSPVGHQACEPGTSKARPELPPIHSYFNRDLT